MENYLACGSVVSHSPELSFTTNRILVALFQKVGSEVKAQFTQTLDVFADVALGCLGVAVNDYKSPIAPVFKGYYLGFIGGQVEGFGVIGCGASVKCFSHNKSLLLCRGFLPSTHLVYYILNQKSRVFSSSFCIKFMSILWEFLCILHMTRFYNLLIVVNKKFTNFARHAGRRATQKEEPGNRLGILTDSPMSNRSVYHRKECGGWGNRKPTPVEHFAVPLRHS